MPTCSAWVEPDVFLTHNEVIIYNTYKDDDINQGANTYSFTASSISDEESFDVRDFDVPSSSLLKNHPPFLAADCNPDFATATDEQKATWKQQWNAWQNGGEEAIIRAVITEAIELGLITTPDDES